MTYLMTSMAIVLVVSLVVSTSSATQLNKQPLASENHGNNFTSNHVTSAVGILADQEVVKKQLQITAESPNTTRKPLNPWRMAGFKRIIKPTITTRTSTTKTPIVNKTIQPSQISECGINHLMKGRIVGGVKVDVEGKFPWMASLLWEKKDGWKHFCGGTLISDRHILTASHCFKEVKEDGTDLKPSDVIVRLGESKKKSSQANPSRQDIKVSAIFMHDGFNHDTKMNDIAILQLKEKIKSTDMVRPICLPSAAPLNLDGKKATIAGWGDLLEDSELGSEFLMEVDVPIIGISQCQKSFSETEEKMPIVKEQICAGYPKGGKDACQGDSGGPLMFQTHPKKPWTAIGVISYGFGCARKGMPGVYARVESYRDWIQSKMAIK